MPPAIWVGPVGVEVVVIAADVVGVTLGDGTGRESAGEGRVPGGRFPTVPGSGAVAGADARGAWVRGVSVPAREVSAAEPRTSSAWFGSEAEGTDAATETLGAATGTLGAATGTLGAATGTLGAATGTLGAATETLGSDSLTVVLVKSFHGWNQ